ncbi:MAG: Uma2 family endonuclease [Chloroflexi bacterium]|nr:Uma2 family endonuclease [Chloroflexota bacterium]
MRASATAMAPSPAPLPMENGDRLTRREFERRYEAMSRVKKAELIEGTVYMPSPIHAKSHAQPHTFIMGLLFNYVAATPSVLALDNPTLRLDEDNEPQPDAVLMIDPAHGGRARINSDDYLEGPPELIVEIASSSVSYDLHQKFNVYRRAGVQEYLVWQVREQALRWWRLDEGTYTPLVPDEAGALRSVIFPGLWLAATPLLRGDMQTVIAVLQQGLQSPEYAGLVRRLSASTPTESPDER